MSNALKAFLMSAATGRVDPLGSYERGYQAEDARRMEAAKFKNLQVNQKMQAMLKAAQVQNEMRRTGLEGRGLDLKEQQFADVPEKRKFEALKSIAQKRSVDATAGSALYSEAYRQPDPPPFGGVGPVRPGGDAFSAMQLAPQMQEQSTQRGVREASRKQFGRSAAADKAHFPKELRKIQHEAIRDSLKLTHDMDREKTQASRFDRLHPEQAPGTRQMLFKSALRMHQANLEANGPGHPTTAHSEFMLRKRFPEMFQDEGSAPIDQQDMSIIQQNATR